MAKHDSTTRRFEVLDLSIEIVRSLRVPVARLQTRERKLAAQIREAASSIALNIGEGRRRRGADRLHHYRIAAGSADETITGLEVAAAWGHLEEREISAVRELVDRVLAMLYRLTH